MGAGFWSVTRQFNDASTNTLLGSLNAVIDLRSDPFVEIRLLQSPIRGPLKYLVLITHSTHIKSLQGRKGG